MCLSRDLQEGGVFTDKFCFRALANKKRQLWKDQAVYYDMLLFYVKPVLTLSHCMLRATHC